MYFPEKALEPREPRIIGYCDACRGEIYSTDTHYTIAGQTFCETCVEEGKQECF